MASVRGQEHVKRALEVAASGGHDLLMSGPPGSGKTLLARAIPSILPRMVFEEALDVTKIYSVSGMLPSDVPLVLQRPFRAPHHTIRHAVSSEGAACRVLEKSAWLIAASSFLTNCLNLDRTCWECCANPWKTKS